MSDEEPTQVDEGTRAFFSSLPPKANEPESAGAHTEPITGDRQSRFPGASAGAAPSDTGEGSAATTLALREEQDVRARAFLWLIFAIAVLTSVAMQLPERESPGKWAASAFLASSGLAAGLLAFVARRRSIQDWPLFGFGALATTTILVSIYHVGVFSPAVMALFVVVYFYGLGDHPVHGWLLFAMGAGGYVLLATLAATGVLSVDRAVFAMHDVERVSMIAATVVITVFLALTLWLARQSRTATVRAVSQLERAHLQIRQREALLHEARHELDKALDVGKIGRFSGQRVDVYVVEEVIGRGAMGEVYAGHHSLSGEPVAIKLLHLHAIDDPTQVGRFLREAGVTSSLMSPHIVRVLGSGHSSDGSPYLAMERLTGHDLAWHLRESRRLGLRETIDLVTQVSQALTSRRTRGSSTAI